MIIPREIRQALEDRFEAWELADFLQVPTDSFLYACEESDWINEDNYDDLLDFADLRTEDRDD